MYEHAPGASATYGATGPSPVARPPSPGPAGSPGSNVNDSGRAVTVAHTGPIDAVTDTGRHESAPARKSSGVRTYAHPNSGSSISKTGTGFGNALLTQLLKQPRQQILRCRLSDLDEHHTGLTGTPPQVIGDTARRVRPRCDTQVGDADRAIDHLPRAVALATAATARAFRAVPDGGGDHVVGAPSASLSGAITGRRGHRR